MQADKTTLSDLSIFNHEEELSVFHHLNFTHTNEGREHLRLLLSKPLDSLAAIVDAQKTIQQLQSVSNKWPATITNGTIMVVERFFDTQVNTYPNHPTAISSFFYKLVNYPDYAITRYTVDHCISFVKGMQQVVDVLHEPASNHLQVNVGRIKLLLHKPMVQQMLQREKKQVLTPVEVLKFGNFLRYSFKHELYELVTIYSKLDAYLSLATACTKYGFCFPQFKESAQPFIEAEGLYHLLLDIPVSYTVQLNKESNFLFLTGANMAGKSTFIKAVGIGVYLAHIGMGVPAKKMQLSLFDGLLSNIQVADNIIKGESYFFNEVQRIKSTIEKISDGKKWLILIDELFKGTNVQDAMKCSTTVIEGLRKMDNALFVLSTHLYEIGDSLKQYANIQFRYFETSVANEQLVFSYQLKEGISNDRLGYLILKKEGVVQMLEKL